jgi:hypothetical protein
MKDLGIQIIDSEDDGTLMDLKIEVVKDTTGLITSGLVIGNTLNQNKALILLTHPNDLKDNPTMGVGIEDLVLSSDLLEYRHKIREQFAKDGLKITKLDLYDLYNVNIEATYE